MDIHFREKSEQLALMEMTARFAPNHRPSKRYRFTVTFQPFIQATVTSSAAELSRPILILITSLAI